MRPNRAELGTVGTARRDLRFLMVPILALVALLSGCPDNSDPMGPAQPPASGFTLRGVVSEPTAGGDTTAVGAVLVEITSGTSAGESTSTDANGAFRFDGVSGQLNLRFSKEGYVPNGRSLNLAGDLFITVSIEPEDAPPTAPTFTLTGLVVRRQDNGGPIGGATVEVVDGPRAGDSATTDAMGRYTLSDLSGDVIVRATRAGFDPVERTVEMTEDRQQRFELATPPVVTMCLDLDDEEVHITNDDLINELVMDDWVLRELAEGNVFRFVQDRECRAPMMGFTLAPGATVVITSGENPENSPPAKIAGWCDAVWNNDGDTARLVDHEGERILEVMGTFAPCGS